jgi:hypothetical protein
VKASELRKFSNLRSLVSCARVNGLEPDLHYLFEELPKATTAAALERLLPCNAKSALSARFPSAQPRQTANSSSYSSTHQL